MPSSSSSFTPFSFLLTILLPFFLSLLCALAISKLGRRISLVDTPNERSSHSIVTSRGGGIGIWLSFLIVGFLLIDPNYRLLIFATGCIGLLGLINDRFEISSKLRLLLQLILSAVIVAAYANISFFAHPTSFLINPLLFLFFVIFITGTSNFYNFMDGINGIAGLSGLVGFGLMAYFSWLVLNAHDVFLMSAVLAAGCLGFLPFNFPRARVFMGDVGSIFLGFVFASFVVKMSANINIFFCGIMFLCTFYSDATVTIFYRWKRGENLMQAHRSHLYQYMSNELGLPHWKVTLLYAVVQLCFGAIAVAAYQKGLVIQLILLLSFSIVFLVSYNLVKKMKPRLSEQ